MNTEELPEDYEPCAECGFDHSYEYAEAQQAHQDILEVNDE